MPTYTFKNNDTEEGFDRFISIADKDNFLLEISKNRLIITNTKIPKYNLSFITILRKFNLELNVFHF